MSNLRMVGFMAMYAAGSAFALEPDVIYQRVAPSIWVVWASNAQGKLAPLASAVVVGEGKLITNCHVVANARNIQVRKESAAFDATLEFADMQRDLCQLAAGNFPAPAVTMGSTKNLRIGQRVYAVNSPRGQELAIGEGIVSSLRSTSDGDQLIQNTVGLSRGSSGGGLFDAEARLVGITSVQASEGPSVNLAQPADWILTVPERGKEALARRQSQAVATTASLGAAASPYPRPLTGDELVAHFKNIGNVEVQRPRQLISLSFRPSSKVKFSYWTVRTPSGIALEGSYQIKGSDQVCFRMPMGGGNPANGGWEWMSDCFRLSQTDQNAYTLMNLRGNADFSYSVP